MNYKEKQRMKRLLPRYSTCKAIVGKYLKENPRCRGSDKLLIELVDRFCWSRDIRRFSHETITRTRRKYNEAARYLPSSKTVAARRNKELAMREASNEGLL